MAQRKSNTQPKPKALKRKVGGRKPNLRVIETAAPEPSPEEFDPIREAESQGRWVKALPDQLLLCRATRNHHWTGFGILYKLDRSNVAQEVTCTQCGMRRVDVRRRGELGVVYRRYFEPEGYSRSPSETLFGTTAVNRLLVQEELFARAEVGATNDDVRAVFDAYRRSR
jgi:hypothetical protein